MTKLLYIGGYGHSGSTLLEYLLTASGAVIACGEVASAAREGARKWQCTCGKPVGACPVWGLLQGSPGNWKHEDLAMALLENDAGKHALMIDSSKTAGAYAASPLRLRQKLGQNFFLLHLVRDPRAVSWSAVKKTERRKTNPNLALLCARTALGWSAANLACERFGRLYPDQYLRLRYEDLVAAPDVTLKGLFETALPGTGWHPDPLGTHDNRHQLYGNRMRGKALELADVKEDTAWQTDMPKVYQALVYPLSLLLRYRYGYA